MLRLALSFRIPAPVGSSNSKTGGVPQCKPEAWTRAAFDTLLSKAGEADQQLWGFSWWNERFSGDNSGHVEMRAQKEKELTRLLKEYLSKQTIFNAPEMNSPPSPKEPCS